MKRLAVLADLAEGITKTVDAAVESCVDKVNQARVQLDRLNKPSTQPYEGQK